MATDSIAISRMRRQQAFGGVQWSFWDGFCSAPIPAWRIEPLTAKARLCELARRCFGCR